MAVISMKALLESGVHFGHRTNKWDPRMKPYIFTERNGIHIIDLQQTSKLLNQSYNVIRDAVANGGMVLFVGTKRQAQETVAEEAARCGMPYVTERWMGGMLTNWATMFKRIQELITIFESRGAKVYLLYLPYADGYDHHAYAKRSREIASGNGAFTCQRCIDVRKLVAVEELRWTDGVHLDERSALIVVEALEKRLLPEL
jgi:hypothetical protein